MENILHLLYYWGKKLISFIFYLVIYLALKY